MPLNAAFHSFTYRVNVSVALILRCKKVEMILKSEYVVIKTLLSLKDELSDEISNK